MHLRLGLVFVLSLSMLPSLLGAQDKEEPTHRGRTLTEWRKDLKDRDAEVRRKAALALAQMGKDAAPAVPDLAAVLQDEKPTVRVAAATAIWRLGPVAKDAAPQVIKAFTDVNQEEEVRLMAGFALGKIGAAHKDVVPTLIDALRGSDRRQAILILGQIGPDAKSAVPDLIKAYENSAMDPEGSKRAAEALKKIDPEAAAKAGIK